MGDEEGDILRAPESNVGSQIPLQVVYIGGYGRSGSSLLDALLGSRPGVVSGGEVCQLFAWCAQERLCSCGLAIGHCPFWGPVVQDVQAQTSLSPAALDHITVEAELHGRRVDRWTEVWECVFRSLRHHHGVARLVDSSKTAGGRRRLSLYGSVPQAELVLMVHLHRSLGGVVHSRRRGGNLQIERGEKTTPPARAAGLAIAGWVRANWTASRARSGPAPYRSLRYDALVADPQAVVAQIVEAVGWDTIAQEEPHRQDHIIAGNRMLRSGWDGAVRQHDSWRRDLPVPWRVLAEVVERLATAVRIVPDSPSRRPLIKPLTTGSRQR